MWASIPLIFVQTIFTFENAIWTASLAILIFHLHKVVNKCQCHQILALSCVKLTSPKNNQWCDVKALTSFKEEFLGCWIYAKLYSAVFMNAFDKNIDKTQPYTTSHFFEIIFCQHRKHWLCPYMAKHLCKVK